MVAWVFHRLASWLAVESVTRSWVVFWLPLAVAKKKNKVVVHGSWNFPSVIVVDDVVTIDSQHLITTKPNVVKR